MALTLKQDFTQDTLANAALIGPTLSFSRASTASYFDSSGVLQEASNGTPRLASHTYSGSEWINQGVWLEESRTNELLWSRDWTNAAYSATNVTAAKDATGLDDVSNSASTLTADANNGTIFQSITLGSAARTSSCYVKRKTGTGTIEFTDDGGSTYTDITSSLSSSLWNRFTITTTQANPSIGFRLGTSGDEIEVDMAGCETGSFVTSPIPTTTASVTRSDDFLYSESTDFSSWWDTAQGTFIMAGRTMYDYQGSGLRTFILVHQGSFGDRQRVFDQTVGNPLTIEVGNVQEALNGVHPDYDTDFELSFAMDTDDSAGSYDGSTAEAIAASHTLPTNSTEAYFGSRHFAGQSTCMFLKHLRYYDERKADSFLEAPDPFDTAIPVFMRSYRQRRVPA